MNGNQDPSGGVAGEGMGRGRCDSEGISTSSTSYNTAGGGVGIIRRDLDSEDDADIPSRHFSTLVMQDGGK